MNINVKTKTGSSFGPALFTFSQVVYRNLEFIRIPSLANLCQILAIAVSLLATAAFSLG